MAVNHPTFGTFCAICFRGLTADTCVVDTDGVKWDICPGDCAAQAGIEQYHCTLCPPDEPCPHCQVCNDEQEKE